ncbi:MAG: ribonuclease Z [Candidatus Syntropharchaeia archaeon]
MLRLVFLGTGGSIPTTNRNPSSILINRKGELILFDCGEGTQQQMMRARTGMKIRSIFITHFYGHGDHFFGLPGLIKTMSFQGRKEPLEIYGPKGVEKTLYHVLSLCYSPPSFEIVVKELKPGDVVRRSDYEIKAIKTEHGIPSVGYVLKEDERRGRFNRERAIELGVKPGPLFSKLHSGESVFVDGKEIKPEEVVGPPRPGRKIVYTGDTRPCESVLRESENADLLIHDGTLSEELKDWALEYRHSTASEAAEIAKKANVKKLILTHISARYSENKETLLKEAKKIFENTVVAEDLMVEEVPYPD